MAGLCFPARRLTPLAGYSCHGWRQFCEDGLSTYRFGANLAVSASLPKFGVRAREAVRIGVLTSLTGDAAAWGRPGLEGCQIWADWVNAQGGLKIGDQRRLVDIVAYDDQYDPARAVLGVKHLVLEQDVKIILMLGGDTVPAISDFLARSKMLATTLLPSDLSPRYALSDRALRSAPDLCGDRG